MTSPLQQYFVDELRLARESAGLTQEQLGKEIKFTRSMVAMIETCQRPPTKDFTVSVDNALKTDGRFDRMRERLLRAASTPDWFRPWVDYEREATSIRWYEPLLVPGLLQTEAYARSLLADEEKVSARMERQQALDGVSLFVIIEEGVLHRKIGDAGVMHQQLTELATTSRAIVQLLPSGADTCLGTAGSFALAVVDGMEVGYVDTPARGFVLDDEGVVSEVRQRWERLLAEALPRSLTQEAIMKVAEGWTS